MARRSQTPKLPELGETLQTPGGVIVPESAVAATENPTHKAEPKKNSVVVEWKEFGKVHTRAYCPADHGEDYKELAKEFAEKKNGKLI